VKGTCAEWFQPFPKCIVYAQQRCANGDTASLNLSGRVLEEMEQLNIVAKGIDICSFINFNIFTDTLNGPLLFEVLRLFISSAISFTLIEFRKKTIRLS
jgi:hypothetical protein